MKKKQEYAGACTCSNRLEIRIEPVHKKENDSKSEILAWLLSSTCRKCNLLFIQGIFPQKKRPVQGIDFSIDETRLVLDGEV